MQIKPAHKLSQYMIIAKFVLCVITSGAEYSNKKSKVKILLQGL